MTNHRIGSRPWRLSRLQPGESALFNAGDNPTNYMQQVAADISRSCATGSVSQRLLLAIHPATRDVINVVEVTRKD